MADKSSMKDEASRSDSQSSETPTNKSRQPGSNGKCHNLYNLESVYVQILLAKENIFTM